MLVKLWSSALQGIEAKPIRIEVAIHEVGMTHLSEALQMRCM